MAERRRHWSAKPANESSTWVRVPSASLKKKDNGVYFIGNCYCWAKILQLIYGGNIFCHGNEIGPNGREIKHYMLRDRNGKIRHFKRVHDFLPEPFCFFLFIGKIESSGKKKKTRRERLFDGNQTN